MPTVTLTASFKSISWESEIIQTDSLLVSLKPSTELDTQVNALKSDLPTSSPTVFFHPSSVKSGLMQTDSPFQPEAKHHVIDKSQCNGIRYAYCQYQCQFQARYLEPGVIQPDPPSVTPKPSLNQRPKLCYFSLPPIFFSI